MIIPFGLSCVPRHFLMLLSVLALDISALGKEECDLKEATRDRVVVFLPVSPHNLLTLAP